MPKLSQIKPGDIIKLLSKKGFIIKRQAGSHIRLYGPNGQRVTVPRHNKSIAPGTVLAICKQANITKKELIELL